MTPDDREQAEIFGRLAGALPRATPPADLLDRVLAEVRPEARVVPLRRPRAVRVGPVLAVAAAVLVAVVAWQRAGDPGAQRAAIAAAAVPELDGEAVLDGTLARISLGDVPPAPPGHHYEVWVLRDGSREMESLGVFRPQDYSVELVLRLPGEADYAAIDISIEADGGPPAHSGKSLAGGHFD